MCIAIYQPKRKRLGKEKLKTIHQSNPDGCGFAYALGNKIQIEKGLFDFDTLWAKYKSVLDNSTDLGIILHFRTASASSISSDDCHPFLVNKELAFVHNGNLFEFERYFAGGRIDNLSDTRKFNQEILQKLPDNFLTNKIIRETLERYCYENYSKMIFMDSCGKVDIINENSGIWVNGIWFSNGGFENYCGYGFSGVYYYNPEDIRHKGGIMSKMVLANQGDWEQCECCLGYHHRSRIGGGICGGCKTYKELMKWGNSEYSN